MEVRTPEELESLFEDAFTTRDLESMLGLFDEEAIVMLPEGQGVVRGKEELRRFLTELWKSDVSYVSRLRDVIEAGDTAVVMFDWSLSGSDEAGQRRVTSGRGIDVLRRDNGRGWRYLVGLAGGVQSALIDSGTGRRRCRGSRDAHAATPRASGGPNRAIAFRFRSCLRNFRGCPHGPPSSRVS